jgi:hypothetical protein
MKRIVAVLVVSSLCAQAPAPTELTVRLTAPLTTKLNRTGDMVVAKIVQPAQFAGGYLEGEIRDIHTGSGAKRSEIFFQFHTLHAGGKESAVTANVVRIVNSKQQADVDEDGGAIEQEHAGRLALLTGSITSKITKGGKQQPSASELTRLSSKAPNISLASGSELTVQFSIPASK